MVVPRSNAEYNVYAAARQNLAVPQSALLPITPLTPVEPGYQEHFGFRRGNVTGVGQALARQEITIFVEEWLRQIPDFRPVAGTSMRMMTGLAHIPTELWLEW